MLSTTLFPALDLLTNPVLLTEPDGTLIYRNEEALKRLQIPHLTRKIVGHFSPNGRKALRNYQNSLPAFLDYDSYETTVTVYVDCIELDGRDVLFYFFSHLFDFSLMEHQKNSPDKTLLQEFSGNKLANLAITAYEREDLPDALHNREGHVNATRVLQKLVSTVLNELHGNGEKFLYTIDDVNEIMSAATTHTLSRFGLNIAFPIRFQENSDILIDFKPFVLLFSQIMVLLAEITVSKSAIVRITEQEDTVLYELAGRIKREYHRIFIGGAESFSHVLPGTLLDLFTFNALCKNQGYEFGFTLRDNDDNNLTFRLKIPIERKYTVSDRFKKSKEQILALIEAFGKSL